MNLNPRNEPSIVVSIDILLKFVNERKEAERNVRMRHHQNNEGESKRCRDPKYIVSYHPNTDM